LLSQLVAKEVIAKYQQVEEKLRRDLHESSCDGNDAVWYLKSWDANGIGIVKIHCGKCQKDFGGNTRDYTNHAISNLFANFGKHYLRTNAHIKSYCRRKGISWFNHPQSAAVRGKQVMMTKADHVRAVEEVNAIVDEVNGHKPFVLVGDVNSSGVNYISFWFKAQCRP
jgi:hypothetical protein